MILTIDGSNSISGGAISYLSNLLKYAEPQKYGIKKIILYGHKKLLEHIEDRSWLKKIYEPELDYGLLSRLKWLWFKFPKLVKNSDLVFFAAANYVKIEIPFVSLCHNILPFVDFKRIYKLSKLTIVNEYRKIFQSKSFENSKGVIFLSKYAERNVVAKLKRKPRFIKIIPHGIPDRFFNTPRKQRDIAEYTKNRPFRFLYVSPIRVYKYQWNVIKGFYMLRKITKYPVTVDFIGPPYDKSAFKIFVKFMKIYNSQDGFANYLNSVPYNEIHKYYVNYDAYIFASLYENMPFSLLEPIASGLPVASSDFELTREILGDNAVYFDPRDPESIAEAVIKLIEDEELREKIAWNNFEKAKKYTWKRCAEETFELFNLCLK